MDEINLDAYEVTAVIDWIDLEIETIRATNFTTLRRLCELPYVEPIAPGPGGACRRFRLRVHDVDRCARLEELQRLLASQFGLAHPIRVTAIEIALDGRSKSGSAEDHARFALHFVRWRKLAFSDNVRLVSAGLPQGMPSPSRALAALLEGKQIAIGNTTDPVYVHAYVKTTDNGLPLPRKQHRGRFEVRLQGSALPVRRLDDLIAFRTERLARFWNCRSRKLLPATANDDLRRLTDLCFAELKFPGSARSVIDRRRFSTCTRQSAAINARVRIALRSLGRRFRQSHPVPRRKQTVECR